MRDAIELFAGSGILGKAAKDMGLVNRIRTQVEIDPYCRQVLARHEPSAERLGDVRTARDLGPCFAVLGGFPCQDISVAGRGAGLDGVKSGLWSEYARIIEESRPRVCIIENAGRGWARWVPSVRRDLHERGYSSVPILLSAADVGAPHARVRCFVIATAHSDGERLRLLSGRPSRARGTRAHVTAVDGAGGSDPDALTRWVKAVRSHGYWDEWPARAVVPRMADGVAHPLLATDRRHTAARNRMIGNGICYPVAIAICGLVAEAMEGL